MTKFTFVSGGVMSGIGKGVTTASLGKILQVRGFKVTAVKIDPYLNVDAGTMNPIAHGEVFVTEDGGEIDMDIGTYERFLDINIPKDHNMTTGQVYLSVIDQERRGDFLGKCVQIIPHITDEIKRRMGEIAARNNVDVALVEIGGTVGDIESLPFLEAARQMRLEQGHENVIYAHVTLVPVVDVVGEQKTKPTQHSVQELRRIGIQPDIIVARSKKPLLTDPKRKIALFCNVEERAVFTSPDLKTVYETPLVLDQQGLGDYLTERLKLQKRKPDWSSWEKTVNSFVSPEHEVKIAICGKYAELADSYVSVNEALRHAAASCNSRLSIDWIETETFEDKEANLQTLLRFDGVLVPGGFGARGTEGKIAAINYARLKDLPFLGICLGFQLAIVAFARSIGLEAANSTEIDSDSPNPVIDLMPEQREVGYKGATMRLGAHEIIISQGTIAEKLYRARRVYERHRHRYELNPKYADQLTKAGMVFSAKSGDARRMEILELHDKYFHFATQFHGEFKSRPSKPSPPYYGFIKACLDRKQGKTKPEFWK
ncbi:CTP synthase (glutamine hydrolyzing) [Candidatus Bathyarchaeota archaeon]|nr:CTP synthase (glutamine hydrolyzing) [Candidatus Bathyarchaeota archaeon]